MSEILVYRGVTELFRLFYDFGLLVTNLYNCTMYWLVLAGWLPVLEIQYWLVYKASGLDSIKFQLRLVQRKHV